MLAFLFLQFGRLEEALADEPSLHLPRFPLVEYFHCGRALICFFPGRMAGENGRSWPITLPRQRVIRCLWWVGVACSLRLPPAQQELQPRCGSQCVVAQPRPCLCSTWPAAGRPVCGLGRLAATGGHPSWVIAPWELRGFAQYRVLESALVGPLRRRAFPGACALAGIFLFRPGLFKSFVPALPHRRGRCPTQASSALDV